MLKHQINIVVAVKYNICAPTRFQRRLIQVADTVPVEQVLYRRTNDGWIINDTDFITEMFFAFQGRATCVLLCLTNHFNVSFEHRIRMSSAV